MNNALQPKLTAPFPYFGGKRSVASVVWERLGTDAENYIEPFFGSGAVLLARPAKPAKWETVNDLDGNLTNFWRSIQHDPEAVAAHADYPVSELDLHARHSYLIHTRQERTNALLSDPDFFDAKAAGWWVWGACLWIGGGWCSDSSLKKGTDKTTVQMPECVGKRGETALANTVERIPNINRDRNIADKAETVKQGTCLTVNTGILTHQRIPRLTDSTGEPGAMTSQRIPGLTPNAQTGDARLGMVANDGVLRWVPLAS